MAEGIIVRHQRGCPTSEDRAARCKCTPSYRAWIYDKRAKEKIFRTFPTLTAAKAWRADARGAVRRGTLRAQASPTLRQAAAEWVDGAKSGMIRTRSGDRYKPSAIRGYEQALRDRVIDDLGAKRLTELQRRDVQDLADRMLADGLDPSTIRNALMPLRVIYRRAVSRGDVAMNPTTGLELPAVRGRRDRIASPSEAAELLTALPIADRPLWATALYAGLRRSELMALRWEDVDTGSGKIRVERSWDAYAGAIEPKSAAGRRTVPILAVLMEYLLDHKLERRWNEGLVFGTSPTHPFTPTAVRRRALTAWKRANKAETARAQEEDREPNLLAPIGLHECRHTCASLYIAAGVNAKTLSTIMGHASITITFDRYGHLMPGSETEAAALVDAYLERANTQERLAQLGPS